MPEPGQVLREVIGRKGDEGGSQGFWRDEGGSQGFWRGRGWITGVLEGMKVDHRGSGGEEGGSQRLSNTSSRVGLLSVGVLSPTSPVAQEAFVPTV